MTIMCPYWRLCKDPQPIQRCDGVVLFCLLAQLYAKNYLIPEGQAAMLSNPASDLSMLNVAEIKCPKVNF